MDSKLQDRIVSLCRPIQIPKKEHEIDPKLLKGKEILKEFNGLCHDIERMIQLRDLNCTLDFTDDSISFLNESRLNKLPEPGKVLLAERERLNKIISNFEKMDGKCDQEYFTRFPILNKGIELIGKKSQQKLDRLDIYSKLINDDNDC